MKGLFADNPSYQPSYIEVFQAKDPVYNPGNLPRDIRFLTTVEPMCKRSDLDYISYPNLSPRHSFGM